MWIYDWSEWLLSKNTLVHSWWECKLVQPLWKTVWRILRKTKKRTTIWPSNSTPGYISENKQTNKDPAHLRRYMHPNVHRSVIYNCQDTEITKMSINSCRDKEDVRHTHGGILLSHSKEWNFPICSNMDGSGGHYAKWNKSDKDKYSMIPLTYGI